MRAGALTPTPLPRGEGVNTKNGNVGCHFAFIPGLFYAKKMRTTGSAKVHVGFIYSSLRETRFDSAGTSRVKQPPPRLCAVLFNRMLDRDNRSLLCYLSP
ncbi:hypothetical protein A8A57_22170 [Lelliottia amnigena]|nr:hypothetical protein A8A57_22170 [Lelliottia amnigena]